MDLSDVRHFTNSTFVDWVLCRHGDEDRWECDGVLIKKNWLPGYNGQETEKKSSQDGIRDMNCTVAGPDNPHLWG
jgi:hypothetical protein